MKQVSPFYQNARLTRARAEFQFMVDMGVKMKFEYIESEAFSKLKLRGARLNVCEYIGQQMKAYTSPLDKQWDEQDEQDEQDKQDKLRVSGNLS